MVNHAGRIPSSAALILASALWGVATVISKALLASVPPVAFLIVQLVPSVGVLWVLVLASGKHPTRRGLFPLALLGLLNPGVSYTLSMLGLARTTASVATLLWAAEPALIMFGAWVLLREKVTLRLLSGIAAAGFGVLLVSGAGTGITVMGESTYGSMLILGGVLCCALYTVISRKIVETIEPLSTVALQQTIGLIWAFSIWYLVQQQSVFQTLAALRSAELLGGAISGLMYYAAAFWLYLNALRSVPATTASIFLNLTPLFAVATAYVFLGERLSLVQWIGGGTILLSVLGLISCDVGEGGLLNLKFQRRRVSL